MTTQQPNQPPWSLEDVREILAGTMDPARTRVADRKGLSPIGFAALKAAATSDALLPLLDLLQPPEDGQDRLSRLLEALEAIMGRLDRIERKLDAISPQSASTSSARPVPSAVTGPTQTGASTR